MRNAQDISQAPSQVATAPSGGALRFWKTLQALLWIAGIALLLVMLFNPPLGVTLFWNILIPVAPALFVVGTGVWRNICPLGTTALLPDRLGISKGLTLSPSKQSAFNLVGVILLMAIIPLRHVLFNNDGRATAIIILALAVVAIAVGSVYERKSAWCSGLCPVHPVEKFYGSGVAFSVPNAHCDTCLRCSEPCPDSTPSGGPFSPQKTGVAKATELLLVGGFPGFVWGWFHVPDYSAAQGWLNLHIVYGYPLLGGAVTVLLYLLAGRLFQRNNRRMIISLFAAAAVSCYYWFRLPMLFGFGELPSNGMLVDLSGSLSGWTMPVLNLVTSGFLVWWIVIHKKKRRSWSIRPEYAEESASSPVPSSASLIA